MGDLIATLRDIVGDVGMVTGDDLAARPMRWGSPEPMAAAALIRPSNTQEISAILKACHAAGQSVVPLGGNTGLTMATQGTGKDIILSLERMTTIEDLNKGEGHITVQAGATLQSVQEAAEAAGLLYPVDLGARGSCTIGGNLATNAGGNEVIRYGMTRQQVLGLEVVLADGTIIDSMKTLIKDNSGYDLKQLFVGSEGTLGIITRAVLRLQPRPTTTNTAFLAMDGMDNVITLLGEAKARLGSNLSGFEVMWKSYFDFMATDPNVPPPTFEHDHSHYVLVQVTGFDPAGDDDRFIEALSGLFESGLIAEGMIAKNENERAAMWAFRDNIPHLVGLWPFLLLDVSVPANRMQTYLDEIEADLEAEFPGYRMILFGHLGDGNLHPVINVPDYNPERHMRVNEIVLGRLKAVRGAISAEHGVGIEKKAFLPCCRTDAEIGVMRAMKTALDPSGILSPGRVFD